MSFLGCLFEDIQLYFPGMVLFRPSNEALNTLKYFYENAPEYVVASAGSLLGVAMSRGNSFPVGKVDFLQVNPISFSEFLSADDSQLFAYIESIDKLEPIPDIFLTHWWIN